MPLTRQLHPEIKISTFHPVKNRDGEYVPGTSAQHSDLYQELFAFKEGLYSGMITELRALQTKAEKDVYKRTVLPCFTFSCNFEKGAYRKTANIREETNVMVIDVDSGGLEEFLEAKRKSQPTYGISQVRDLLYDKPFVLFSGISASGTGFFFMVKHEPEKREDVFADIQFWMKDELKITIDSSCSDIVRLRFATWDDGAKIKAWKDTSVYSISNKYIAYKKSIEDKKKDLIKLAEKRQLVVGDAARATETIVARAESMIFRAVEGTRHHTILKAARLLGGYVGSGAIGELEAINTLQNAVASINYPDETGATRAIRDGLNAGKLAPIEVTIIAPSDPNFDYFSAQEASTQEEIKKLYSDTISAIRRGIPMGSIDIEELAATHYISTVRVTQIVSSLYDKFAHEFGILNKPIISQIEVFLANKYDLRRDIITGTLFSKYSHEKVWSKAKLENIWRDVQIARYKFGFDDLKRLLTSDFVPTVNLWEEYFESIKGLDADRDYIKELASHIQCTSPKEQQYFEMMFKKMLVRTIKCALVDSYPNRYVFVLSSKTQSNGKSWFIRWLSPFDNQEYYAENPLEDNKDSRIRLAETFIYNLEELASITKFEINRLKATVSQVGSRERKPYGHSADSMVRRCSFYASTNNSDFLTDDVNTRWLCFDINRIDWKYSKVCDKNQIWGQAYSLFKSGFDCELTDKECEVRDTKNLDYRSNSLEGELLQKYFENADKDALGCRFMTTTSILQTLSSLTKDSRVTIHAVSLGKALSRLDFKKVRTNNMYGYYVIPLNEATAAANQFWDNQGNKEF
tara:strand:- start:1889 stop:4297 length:2409 start_codon:yes stop_codon:yes gene_type:complete